MNLPLTLILEIFIDFKFCITSCIQILRYLVDNKLKLRNLFGVFITPNEFVSPSTQHRD